MKEVTKTNLILAAVIVILLGYILITRKSTAPINNLKYQTEIDSLNRVISGYHLHQLDLDKKISNYELDIKKLGREIDSTKQVIIDQRAYYGEQIRNAGRYTPTELDDFFTKRYK